jgi:RHS repeat-associated protein
MRGITPDGFTGHEHLDNLDLIHMNGRVYDPQLGRFISADPFVSSPYVGQSLNRYSYVWNNPLSFVDPSGFNAETPCMVTQSGACARVTVIGLRWGTAFHFVGGSGFSQVESASQRDPCGQDSSTFACAMQSGTLVSPSQIVLTAGTKADPTLSRSPVLDYLQGAAARIGNIAMSSSPVSWLFGAHPDFEWFDVPDSQSGQAGAQMGDVGYLVGGAAGIVRKAGTELVTRTPSAYARSLQGTDRFPGIDTFKDITLKKGTVIYGGIPGQSAFYTTVSAMRRSGHSASTLANGLQTGAHPTRGLRTRFAAYEVMDDTAAAFGLALANTKRGAGWYPQIVVPSFQTSLRLLDEIPLGP